jgi:hypothetical protein
MANLDFFYGTNANIASFGGNGVRLLNVGESLPAGDVAFAVLSLDNAVIESTVNNPKGDTSLDTILFSGIMVYSEFTAITVTDGTILAYLK